MADVAENEPPALPSGADEPTPPRGMDAAEYRRFQEFQRFQDYQRFVQQQGGGPPANLPVPMQPGVPVQPGGVPVQPGAPVPQHPVEAQLAGMQQQLARIERVTNPPLWQKILRNKWLHRAVWLVIIVALASWGVPKLIHRELFAWISCPARACCPGWRAAASIPTASNGARPAPMSAT